jgi:hypothetical protein
MFAAMAAGRNSVGVELDAELAALVDRECEDGSLVRLGRERAARRLAEHQAFLEESQGPRGAGHRHRRYGLAVVTSQETGLVLDRLSSIRREGGGLYRAQYEEAAPAQAPPAAGPPEPGAHADTRGR